MRSSVRILRIYTRNEDGRVGRGGSGINRASTNGSYCAKYFAFCRDPPRSYCAKMSLVVGHKQGVHKCKIFCIL